MSTGTGGDYWATPALPSRFKHKLLSQYIPQFGGKTGSVGKRVVYLDGYAGGGQYQSGDPGSAEIALRVAADQLARGLRWRCFFVERDAESVTRLEKVADPYRGRGVDAHVRRGEVEGLLDEVVAAAEGAPLFLFLDPCGLGVPFEQMVHVCARQRAERWPPTELLMNFSLMAVRRLGGNASSAKGREASSVRMDVVCGGRWWRDFYADGYRPDADELVADEYAARLQAATGMMLRSVPVTKKPRHRPVYHLVFGTRSQHGLWVFGDAAARARDHWWAELDVQETEADPGMLFSVASVQRPDPDEVEREAIPHIAGNLAGILARRGAFKVVDHTLEVFGAFYGQVTEPVVRKAVKELHRQGGTACAGTGGRPCDLRVTPPVGAGPRYGAPGAAPSR